MALLPLPSSLLQGGDKSKDDMKNCFAPLWGVDYLSGLFALILPSIAWVHEQQQVCSHIKQIQGESDTAALLFVSNKT